jgi:plasmid stability protein
MNITIKDLPEDVHARLCAAARRSGRSLNKQIVTTLERAVCSQAVDRGTLLERVRRRREGMEMALNDALLEGARREGRK